MDQLLILPETVSPARSGPVLRKGDDAWLDVMRRVHFAQVAGELEGVTSASVQSQLASTNPGIRRLLRMDAGVGESLGLPRGRNALATEGGLQSAPLLR